MSATTYSYTPPPTVRDTSPWQRALSTTMQDTGGGSPYGYQYGPVAPDWTPWALGISPQENAGYNYTNATSLYDPSRDVIDHTWGGDPVHGPVHSHSRDIVMRWFNDDRQAWERANGRNADTATLQRIFLNDLARLHRDFDANGWNWADSGFAGFDQYLTGGPGGQGATSGYGQPGGPSGGPIDYSQPPGQPGYGAPPVPPAPGGGNQQGGNMADQTGGTSGTSAAYSKTYNTPQNRTANTTTGGGYQLGALSTDPLYAYYLAQNGQPEDQLRLIRESRGLSGPPMNRLSGFRDKLYANAMKAYLMLSQLQNPDQTGPQDLQSFMASMLTNGGAGMPGFLQGGIDRLAGLNLAGIPNDKQEQAYRAGLALKSLFSGGLASDINSQRLDNALYSIGEQIDRDPNADPSLQDILRGGQYGGLMNQYLGVR